MSAKSIIASTVLASIASVGCFALAIGAISPTGSVASDDAIRPEIMKAALEPMTRMPGAEPIDGLQISVPMHPMMTLEAERPVIARFVPMFEMAAE